MTIWWFALALLCVVVGVLGTLLPILPGPPLVFAGMLLAAWADGFSKVGWPHLAGLGLLTLATVLIDFLAASWGAARLRASPWAVAGAAVGSLLGLLAGLPGLIAGPFVGAMAGEYWARRELRQAGRVGLAAWLGMIVGGTLKLALVVAMVVWFALAFFF